MNAKMKDIIDKIVPEQGQLYYNKKDRSDFLYLMKSNFPDQDHFQVRHLRELGYYFLFREKWDNEQVISKKELKEDYTIFIKKIDFKDKLFYEGSDKLNSYVHIYPFPDKLKELIKEMGVK